MQSYYMQVEPLFSQLERRGVLGRWKGVRERRQAVCVLLCFALTSQGHMTSSVFNGHEVPFCPLTPTHTLTHTAKVKHVGDTHADWCGNTVCASSQSDKDQPPDPVQPLSEDQCQTGRDQQHHRALHEVGRAAKKWAWQCHSRQSGKEWVW